MNKLQPREKGQLFCAWSKAALKEKEPSGRKREALIYKTGNNFTAGKNARFTAHKRAPKVGKIKKKLSLDMERDRVGQGWTCQKVNSHFEQELRKRKCKNQHPLFFCGLLFACAGREMIAKHETTFARRFSLAKTALEEICGRLTHAKLCLAKGRKGGKRIFLPFLLLLYGQFVREAAEAVEAVRGRSLAASLDQTDKENDSAERNSLTEGTH